MDGRNLNEILKQDPSLEDGACVKVFERQCNIQIKIIEMSIIQMVGQEVQSEEKVNFKILVKGHENIEDENLRLDPEQNPDIIRLEIMSDNDYFFQYIYE